MSSGVPGSPSWPWRRYWRLSSTSSVTCSSIQVAVASRNQASSRASIPNWTAWNSSWATVTRMLGVGGRGKPVKSLSSTQYDDATLRWPGTSCSGAVAVEPPPADVLQVDVELRGAAGAAVARGQRPAQLLHRGERRLGGAQGEVHPVRVPPVLLAIGGASPEEPT